MSESELELAQRFDRVSDRLGLTPDERSEILILYPDSYSEWVRTGSGGEIKQARLKEIANTLERVAAHFSDSESAREWLISPDPRMGRRVPSKVLRVGRVRDVRNAIKATVSDGSS